MIGGSGGQAAFFSWFSRGFEICAVAVANDGLTSSQCSKVVKAFICQFPALFKQAHLKIGRVGSAHRSVSYWTARNEFEVC